MSDIASIFKAEIARVARKEVRAQTEPIKKASSHHRSSIAALRKEVDALEKQLARLQKTAGQGLRKAVIDRSETDRGLRFRANGFASLRKKLGISAAQMGQLIGVTGQSIYAWEAGKSRPRASQLEAIAAVRPLGKREIMKRLEAAE
jgi:DNA-binding XRE family transcriptional regulator